MNESQKIIPNFKNLSNTEQKNAIIEVARFLFETEQKSISYKELEYSNVAEWDIQRLFGSLQKLRKLVGAPTYSRKSNMTDKELIAHIESLAQKPSSCPSYKKPGTVCFLECNCWVNDKISKDRSGRAKIKYKGKVCLLYRVYYSIAIGPINPGMDLLHLCDNTGCFMLEHLEEGTAKDNADQCVRRGRNTLATKPKRPRHKIEDPCDLEGILAWAKDHSIINEKEEWLYDINIDGAGYARICIKGKSYFLHRLILANKLGIPYEAIGIACHKFPENSPFSWEAPSKNDVNPDHLYNGTSSSNSNDAKQAHKGYDLSPENVQLILEEASKTDFLMTKARDFDISIAKLLNISAKTVRRVRTGETYSDWHNAKIKVLTHRAVVQLNMQGEFIARHSSGVEASKAINKGNSGISMVCNGHKECFAGHIWMHEDTYNAQLVAKPEEF